MRTLRDCFQLYNQRVFPLQILMAAAAIILAVLLFLLPGATATLLMKAFLSITFAWIGLACLLLIPDLRRRFPLVSFSTAAACLPLAVIFCVDLFAKRASDGNPVPRWRLYVSLLMMGWGIILYPLTGRLSGHHYPRVPLFGVMPCPTNIFALGFLTAFSSTRLDTVALYMLSSMAVIGGVKAALCGYDGERIREDLALVLSGLYGFVIGLAVL